MRARSIVVGLVAVGGLAIAAQAGPRTSDPAVTIDGDVSAEALVATARPALAPPSTMPTTRAIADAAVVAQHPTHARGDDFTLDTCCRGTACVEELRLGGRIAIGRAAALARLRAATSDAGHDDDTDATELLLLQPSAPGWRSLVRIESDYTRGAAHARTSIGCETYRVATARRATLADVIGAGAARRFLAAATAALAADGRDGVTVSAASFEVPAAGTIRFCVIRGATITPVTVAPGAPTGAPTRTGSAR